MTGPLLAVVVLLAASVRPAGGLQDLYAEPLSLEARAEVPIFLSFTTGTHPAYGQALPDDGTGRMMVSMEVQVYCRPEIEPCFYVLLGQNANCQKVLECPGMPPISRCISGPAGILTLELRGTLEERTQYNLLVLGTLPPSLKRIQALKVRTLVPGSYVDVTELRAYEEATQKLPTEFITQAASSKQVSLFDLVAPQSVQQGVLLQQYTFKVAGTAVPFAKGDMLKIISGPFIFPDEGLSFGGTCAGFDTSGFASPLRGATCQVVAIPALDARVGYNAIILTFGTGVTLAQDAQYFRISINTPKLMGSFQRWFIASKDTYVFVDSPDYNKVLPSTSSPFIVPNMNVVVSAAARDSSYSAQQRISVKIFPRVNLLGSTQSPPKLIINAPPFFTIVICSSDAPYPDLVLVAPGSSAAFCRFQFDNENLYAHQSINVDATIRNPDFATSAQPFVVTVISGDGMMTATQTFAGWPVYSSLRYAFIVPLSLEYAQFNEIQVFFRPIATTPTEPRLLVAAPQGFLFVQPCQFQIIVGFPSQGVQCSNPLSATGLNLFSLMMPVMGVFEEAQFYAVSVYPLRNPFPGSFSGPLDSLPFRLDILASDGVTILETSHNVPLGPYLRGMAIYPAAVHNPAVRADVRTPSTETQVVIQFQTAVPIVVHGERILLTAPYGYQWKINGTAQVYAKDTLCRTATLIYSPQLPPVAPPNNQLELSLITPDISAGTDVSIYATIIIAPIDPLLNDELVSANVWIIELYEPGAGYLEYKFRHQASMVPGFDLQAITGGTFTAWLPYARNSPSPLMVTFRLGTDLAKDAGVNLQIQLTAPLGFIFPADCEADRISPIHLEEQGYSRVPVGAIARCFGGGDSTNANLERIAAVNFTDGTVLQRRLLYAIMLQVLIPATLPVDNAWTIRSMRGNAVVEQEVAIPGFKLGTEFLSAVYHPGTTDTGEDLRVGASDNRVTFSMQPSTAVLAGGDFQIIAPYRFLFARDCLGSVYSAKDILNSIASGSQVYSDLPALASCTGVSNVAHLVFAESLDVAIQYTFRISVMNPLLPHPPDWPFTQDIWRFATFDPQGVVLNAGQVQAFYLWAFALAMVSPGANGAGETVHVTIEVQPSLTVPPRGLLRVLAPDGFVIPVPCSDLQLDTFGAADGYSPLPPATTCGRSASSGGQNTVDLRLDDASYLAASLTFRFRILVVHPALPTVLETEGPEWSLTSLEPTDLGDSFLERNPAVAGYPLFERLKDFAVIPASRVAEQVVSVTVQVSLQDSLGTFEVVTTTEASYLVVDMPLAFAVPVTSVQSPDPGVGGATMYRCTSFTPIYPEEAYFPAPTGNCYAVPQSPSFRLRLTRNVLVGPQYRFAVGIQHPKLTSLLQKQILQVNVWQVRLVRFSGGTDLTRTSRSVSGYRVLPLLQDCTLRTVVGLFSVRTSNIVSVSFRVVTALSAAQSHSLRIAPPPSMASVSGWANSSTSDLCQFWVAGTLQPTAARNCVGVGNALEVQLLGSTQVAEDSQVQVDFRVYGGNVSLLAGESANRWSIVTLDSNSSVLDQALDVPGFRVYASLENTALIPGDVAAMSYANFAEFQFQVSATVDGNISLVVVAPTGFVLYPMAFRATDLPGAGDPTIAPRARQGSSSGEVIITLLQPLLPSVLYAFHLTIGNPAVSPPLNTWTLELRDARNQTVGIDSQIQGFLVQSAFNMSSIEGQIDEPLSENYVHVTVAVNQRLLADGILTRNTCVPTMQAPICPERVGLNTYLVLTAPDGFIFQATCGFWVLSRVGSLYSGLPPGSLCRVDPDHQNIARVQVSLSLEPLQIYEFTLQVRNAMSVPLDNYWELSAIQDGVIREHNAFVQGFALRQLRTVRLQPSTVLAGVVDNTVTVQLRSERPLTNGGAILIVAPVGFIFDGGSATTSFKNPVTVQQPDPGSIRMKLSQQDFVPPNTYFFVAATVRNPDVTPVPNYWYFYLQSQYMEHIDLRKYFDGFVIAYKTYYCTVYPNTVPWLFGTTNQLSLLFVTKTPLFTNAAAAQVLTKAEAKTAIWQLSLVAPYGFSFPAETGYSDRCANFRRWGGKDSYEQLPETAVGQLTCVIQTSRSVLLTVPTTLVNQTRYSFQLTALAAAKREDIALQGTWTLTVLLGGQILHLGESASPLMGEYYEPEWFFSSTS